MQQLSMFEHAEWTVKKWVGWIWPTRPAAPRRPWWSDGDRAFRRVPTRPVAESAKILLHVARSGRIVLGLGDVRPEPQGGRTDGIPLNVATDKDPLFTISTEPGPRNLFVQTFWRAPYGRKVRIGKGFIAQGYPMNGYSDHKMHVIDPASSTVVEIQNIQDATRNVAHDAWARFVGWLTGRTLHGGYICDMVSIADLNEPSSAARGASAAQLSIVGLTLRADDLRNGYRGLSWCAVPQPRKYPAFVPPALGSDGPSTHPDAIKMGQVIRPDDVQVAKLLAAAKGDLVAVGMIESWRDYGMICLDTSANVYLGGVEPDPTVDVAAMERVRDAIDLAGWRVWEFVD